MKRVLMSVTGTVVGVVALLSFKTHGPIAASGTGLPSASLPSTSATSSSTGAPPDPTASGTSSSKSPATAKSTAPPSSTASSPSNVSYTGTAVETRYGVVQVKVTVASKKITDVSFVQLTAFDGRSQEINSQAAPILLQETLQAQSANIDTVSGASYTSAGYQQSLQSALDQAGI